ncbi:hypothetical protein QVD17_04511 [Tagetes erecta]|uniref:Uncharacterized protein n=1 Tax=Tagetes erecta TaxID=13708 RepID=A0AAD8LGU0_TARER|nr:hypothetical protein QVD17_04511 [Tagetes erecta]
MLLLVIEICLGINSHQHHLQSPPPPHHHNPSTPPPPSLPLSPSPPQPWNLLDFAHLVADVITPVTSMVAAATEQVNPYSPSLPISIHLAAFRDSLFLSLSHLVTTIEVI